MYRVRRLRRRLPDRLPRDGRRPAWFRARSIASLVLRAAKLVLATDAIRLHAAFDNAGSR